ncbi:hypothetical protein ACWEWX_45650, partial [Streptomyces asiaticus]
MADLDVKYIGVATADDGRDGRVVSDDGVLDLTVTPPPGVLYKVEQMRSVAPVEGEVGQRHRVDTERDEGRVLVHQ